MKVLHIISSSGMFGAEAVILNLSRQLNDCGHASELAVFSHAGRPTPHLHSQSVSAGIVSYIVPCAGQVDRGAIRSIRGLVATCEADVVHAHGYKADIYCWFALRGSGVPLVSTCHNWIDSDPLVTLYGRADRMVLRRYARVVAVSADVRKRLLDAGVPESRILIVRNGIALESYAGAKPSLRAENSTGSPVYVGIVGRLSSEKGMDLFLRAAPAVLAEFPDTRFVVVGDGPDRERLENLIHELDIRRHVRIAGRRDDMPSVYASLDIMVSASRQEGLPMAVLEGMATGLPLVATTVGEVPAVVQDGRTGILVPPENPASLAGAILTLLRDPAKRAAMGVAGRQRVREEFSADRMAANYLQVYEHAIAATGASGSGEKTA